MQEDPIHCLIVGGGPAGLTAAIYLGRFHLSASLVDGGASRASLIPCTRNHAGFPEGIAGRELVDRMRRQALIAGAKVYQAEVEHLERRGEIFVAKTSGGDVAARAVLIATGVTNLAPEMPVDLHAAALAAGALRYCPVCDGFEVTDKPVAVVGTGARGVKEALFLRSYTPAVSLISNGPGHCLDGEEGRQLAAAGVEVLDGPASDFALTDGGLSVATARGRRRFTSIYPALGSDIHSHLARKVGAAVTEEGCIKVDAHQRTTVPGLYAAGDVVSGLDQISHAMGEAAVAATAMRNDLAASVPLRR